MDNNLNTDRQQESKPNLPMVIAEKRKTLTRSKRDRIFLGLCGGIAEYFNVEAAVIRILFVITILIGGWGVIVYVLASLLIPSQPLPEISLNENHEKSLLANAKLLTGSILTITGLFFIFDIFGIINYFSFVGISPELFGTLTLIFIGLYIYGRKDVKAFSGSEPAKLLRSSTNKRFSGFCAGLAKYLNTDSNFVRMAWLIFTFLTLGVGLILYVLTWILVPPEMETNG